jgi:hypothetical protein
MLVLLMLAVPVGAEVGSKCTVALGFAYPIAGVHCLDLATSSATNASECEQFVLRGRRRMPHVVLGLWGRNWVLVWAGGVHRGLRWYM